MPSPEEPKSINLEETGTNLKIDAGENDSSEDDLNSTMMSIDIGSLDLDGKTSTSIQIKSLSDDEIIHEQIEKKKGSFERFLNKLKQPRIKKVAGRKLELPQFLKAYQGVWICDEEVNLKHRAWFYINRLAILAVSVFLHVKIIQLILSAYSGNYPEKNLYVISLAVEIGMLLCVLIFKMSPGWTIALPLSLVATLIAVSSFLFHVTNPFYFVFVPEFDFLNVYYGVVVATCALMSLLFMAQKNVSRVYFVLLSILCAVPLVLNVILHLELEYAFFGTGFFEKFPYYAQPVFVVFHGIFPLLFLSTLFLWLVNRDKESRGFAASLAFLLLFMLGCNIAVMQKNRVTHVLNFFIPKRLDVGSVELVIQNQTLKIETANFQKYGAGDYKSRYKMNLKNGTKENQYLLQVVDEYGFPVKFLEKADLRVFSDDDKIKSYQMSEDQATSLKRGSYSLDINLPEKKNIISWDHTKKDFTDKDSLEFEISDLTKVKRILLREGDENILDVTGPKDTKFLLSMGYFEAGKHELGLSVYDSLDQEVFNEEIVFQVAVAKELTLLSPIQNDVVNDTLPVVMLAKSVPLDLVQMSEFYIDDQKWAQSADQVNYHNLDVSALANGQHVLKVILKFTGGEYAAVTQFSKSSQIGELVLTDPGMGSFAMRQLKVAYRLDGILGQKIAGIQLYVNGLAFDDITVENNSFVVPISHWSQNSLTMVVQATLDNGTKLSDWVQINKGLGVLDLSFDTKNLDFLNYKNIAVILDATESTLDNWQGKNKWRTLKKLVTEQQVSEIIKYLNPSFYVFGASKMHYYNDCEDTDLVLDGKEYNHVMLGKKLAQVDPKGVSSLYKSLITAFAARPDKIFVFTDSSDACGIKTVQKKLFDEVKASAGNTQIVIFALGQISDNDKRDLQKLADDSGGHFYQPDTYNTLQNTWLNEMVLKYELYSQKELIQSESLGSRKLHLLPGNYTLKIPYANKVEEVNFTIENGGKTTLVVSGEKGVIHVNETHQRL